MSMWDYVRPDQPSPGEPGPWRNRDRVTHDGRPGRVGFERLGFVQVYWDEGGCSDVWGADLAREETE